MTDLGSPCWKYRGLGKPFFFFVPNPSTCLRPWAHKCLKILSWCCTLTYNCFEVSVSWNENLAPLSSRYVVSSLEMLVAEDYLIIYMNGATPRSKMPGISWLKKCYQMIDRRWEKEKTTEKTALSCILCIKQFLILTLKKKITSLNWNIIKITLLWCIYVHFKLVNSEQTLRRLNGTVICVVLADWGRTWSLWSSLIPLGSYALFWLYPGPLSGDTHRNQQLNGYVSKWEIHETLCTG